MVISITIYRTDVLLRAQATNSHANNEDPNPSASLNFRLADGFGSSQNGFHC